MFGKRAPQGQTFRDGYLHKVHVFNRLPPRGQFPLEGWRVENHAISRRPNFPVTQLLLRLRALRLQRLDFPLPCRFFDPQQLAFGGDFPIKFFDLPIQVLDLKVKNPQIVRMGRLALRGQTSFRKLGPRLLQTVRKLRRLHHRWRHQLLFAPGLGRLQFHLCRREIAASDLQTSLRHGHVLLSWQGFQPLPSRRKNLDFIAPRCPRVLQRRDLVLDRPHLLQGVVARTGQAVVCRKTTAFRSGQINAKEQVTLADLCALGNAEFKKSPADGIRNRHRFLGKGLHAQPNFRHNFSSLQTKQETQNGQ